MIRGLSAALLLAATSVSAAPLALPSFENAASQLQATVKAQRAASVKTMGADIGAGLDSLSWDLQTSAQDAARMRDDLRLLITRVDTRAPGAPADQTLTGDLQRFNQDLQSLAQDSQFRLNDLRSLSAQAQKDPNLVAHAQNLDNAARGLASTTKWLVFDVGFDTADLSRAGYTFESMDLDRYSRDADQSAQDLQNEADRLLAKVR
ncbi:MAG: hypothetical protein HKL90_00485 [Elusimicrobia bacterium]|nr:hypothetical protein [Elusimicrobiota bacterium]